MILIPAGQIAIVPVMVASSVLQPLRDGDRQERMDPETESWLDHQLKSIQQLDFHDFFGFSIFHRPLDFIYCLSIFSFPTSHLFQLVLQIIYFISVKDL